MTRSSRRPAGLALALALTVAAFGCGGGGPPMGDVEGTVTIDDSPAAAGTVTFTPADGVRPSAAGEIKDGRYAVKAPVGACKVQLSVLKKIGEKKAYGNDPKSPSVPVYEDALGPEYNSASKLTHDVTAGKSTKNWEAKSRPKK